MRIIDLSVEIDNKNPSEEVKTKIKYIPHKKGALLLGLSSIFNRNQKMFVQFPSMLKKILFCRVLNHKSFINNEGLSTEFVRITSHTGTHIDSPYHYSKRGIKISEANLETFYNKGVLFDFSNRELTTPLQLIEVIDYIEKNNIDIQANNIILFYTGASKNYGVKEYLTSYYGISEEVLQFLLSRGIKVIGTDAFSLDQPFDYMNAKYEESGDKRNLWPIHMKGSYDPFFMIEKLNNLDQLVKIENFKIIALPIKLKDASASWSRVVAIVE